MTRQIILPGGTIGLLGDGLRGRAFAKTAVAHGYKIHAWTPPGANLFAGLGPMVKVLIAPFTDRQAFREFTSKVDVVTFESENVPLELVIQMEKRLPVSPSSGVLIIARNRRLEKDLFDQLGIPHAITFDATRNLANIGIIPGYNSRPGFSYPAFLKHNRRGGYDGEDQWLVANNADLLAAYKLHAYEDGGEKKPRRCMIEMKVPFISELLVAVIGSVDGTYIANPATRNERRDGIQRDRTPPAPGVMPEIEKRAQDIALSIARKLELVGGLIVKLFILEDGTVLANKIVPRLDDSLDSTIEASGACQNLRILHAICGREPLPACGAPNAQT